MLHVVDYSDAKADAWRFAGTRELMCEKKDYAVLIGCDGLLGPAKANLDVQP